MRIDLRPWRRLVAVWLPAVLLCVAMAVLYGWQTSESVGLRAQLGEEVATLEAELARLEGLRELTASDRARVVELDQKFGVLYSRVFGDLESRLTGIMGAVGAATRDAGLLPGSFSYSANEDRSTGYIRFGIQFGVEGEYQQIRQLLVALQASPEFLIVERLTLAGDEQGVVRELGITIGIATYLAEADEDQLRRLTGGFRSPMEADSG